MIKLPSTVVVKIDHDFNRLYFFDLGCYDINIVNGTEFGILKIYIGRNNLNRALGFCRVDGDILIDITIVAHLITCGEFDHVLTVCENNIV